MFVNSSRLVNNSGAKQISMRGFATQARVLKETTKAGGSGGSGNTENGWSWASK